jgi:hypothetical protein
MLLEASCLAMSATDYAGSRTVSPVSQEEIKEHLRCLLILPGYLRIASNIR